MVGLSHAGRRVGGGHDAKEERTYELKDVLIGAAIKAGAKAPLGQLALAHADALPTFSTAAC